LLEFVSWQALVTLLFLVGVVLSPLIGQLWQILKARLTPIPHYQPSPAQPPLKPTYEQGYQEQTARSASRSSRAQGNGQPKQDLPGTWDQPPQVATPEQAPPPMQ
jgi:hypothetical protein